ncbi:hypothetical protein J3Q64DRAFT_1872161 [Phycomyces blakesleeanus]|uniref:Lactate/malate dehydrogenase N-terminal domain-containing protein n=2 Tax=Phycomyces blakesleeanus TaxID=4837 RepID=A0ABR3ANZ1_PHYBL
MPCIKRVAIIGAGSLGASVAYALLMLNSAKEIILVDLSTGILEGQVLDLFDAAYSTKTLVRSGTFQEAGQSSIIIITADRPQGINETRKTWLQKSRKLIQSIAVSMEPIHPKSLVVVAADPVDVFVRYLYEKNHVGRSRVFGTNGTAAATMRLQRWIADITSTRSKNVVVYVVGSEEHPVVLWHSAKISGQPVRSLPILIDNRHMIPSIVSCEKRLKIKSLKGDACFGKGAHLARLVHDILIHNTCTHIVTVYIQKVQTCLSIPVSLGRTGIQYILEPELSPDEAGSIQVAVERSIKDYQQSILDPQ